MTMLSPAGHQYLCSCREPKESFNTIKSVVWSIHRILNVALLYRALNYVVGMALGNLGGRGVKRGRWEGCDLMRPRPRWAIHSRDQFFWRQNFAVGIYYFRDRGSTYVVAPDKVSVDTRKIRSHSRAAQGSLIEEIYYLRWHGVGWNDCLFNCSI